MKSKIQNGKKTDKQEAPQRIISAAACLFAKKGYAAVGIREIAAKAKINISMISYYYGGKVGLLKALVSEYFRHVDGIAIKVSEMNLGPGEAVRKYVSEMINLIREKENLCRVAIIEMPIELQEITKLKTELLRNNMRLMSSSLSEGFKIRDKRHHIIIGPAFLGLIYSGFLFQGLIEKVTGKKLDDEFFDNYSETISGLFLDGMNGISLKRKAK
jgi:AcrR family transcriptional regulator